MERLEGRTAVITGAAGGIGLGIAEHLLKAGVRVMLADIDHDELEAVAARLGTGADFKVLDVTDRQGWAAVRALTEDRFGPVDILVNNAGIGPDGREIVDIPPESFDRLVAIKLTGTYNGIATFGPGMRARG